MTQDFWANEDWDSRAVPARTTQPVWRVSGRWMVVGLIAFGVLTTASMWIYWTLHVGPFRPLQDALAVAFPHSSPRVNGGQRKMHKGTPRVLRVVLRVDFDPVLEKARGEGVVDVVQGMAGKYLDLGNYDELQVFLFHGVPEQELRQQEYNRTLHPSATSAKPENSAQTPKA
jgi:hypothetical protein